MCGIFGVYSLLNEYIDGSLVIKALAVMRERGTRHGAGVALYAPPPTTGLSSSHMCLPQMPQRCISYPAAYTT